MKRTGNQFLTLTLVTMHIAATAAAEQGPVPTADTTAGAQAATMSASAGGTRAPAYSFPRIVVGHAMLWGTPHSPRFRPGYVPSNHPGYTASGFYENAPLVPADTLDAGKDDRAHFPKAWFEDLRNAGIDAVDHCYFDSTPITTLLETMEAAKASGTPARLAVTFQRPAQPPAVIGIERAGNGAVSLSWPAAAGSFTLYTTTNLAPPVWTLAPNEPVLSNGVWLVPLSPATGAPNLFFRLQTQVR